MEPGGWDERLERLGLADAYLGRGYLESARILDPGRPVLLELDGAAVFACLVREFPDGGGREDVTTPYGYGGPVAASPEAGAAFWDAYRAWARDRGVVTTFVRFHPLYENHRYAPEAGRERLADTATWPLMPGADLYAGMHAKHRSDCRKSEQAGLEVSVATAPPLDDFAALYEATMRERDAADFYLFPPGYWEALAALGDGLLRVDGRLDGELVASTLCLASPPWLHYHLAAMNDAGRSLGASKVTLLEAARWGQERGYEELHLGSGLGGAEDSLWKFKQRFSDHPGRELWIGKLVHDADAYRELGGTDSTDGFFPAYRASG